ncbi:MAG: carbohydrate ABC transporter permease, partial [Spirochaetota bacterium]
IFLYYAVDKWNGWFYASIFLRNTSLYPLALVLRQILLFGENAAEGASAADVEVIGDPLRFAIIIVSSIPILILYPFLQKYFTKGALIGGVKE